MEGSRPGLTEAQAEIFGKTCATVLKIAGPRAMLACLKEFLDPFYHITRIFLGLRHSSEGIFLPVADTLPGAMLLHGIAGRSLNDDQVRKLMVDDSKPYFFNEDPFPEARHGNMRHEDFLSHLRIPLFRIGAAAMHAGFSSEKRGIFGKEDAAILQHMLLPVAEELQRLFRYQSPVGAAHDFNFDSYTLLKNCPDLSELLSDLEKVSPLETSVLVLGETGAGKDVVADAIHQLSPRRNKPIVRVNCSAVSESLLENELFGHEKGAFTGADGVHQGLFESAAGGTVFLDEIGELTPRMQAELLRVLDNREICRVGGTKSIALDIRVVAATNRDLDAMVEAGTFRRDLLFRLNVFPVEVPPLRRRRMDIPVLASLFAAQISSRMGMRTVPEIPGDEMEKLCRYDWPGNVRELRNRTEREIIRAMNGTACNPLRYALPAASPVPRHRHTDVQGPAAMPADAMPTLEEFGDWYAAWVLEQAGGKISGRDGAAARLGIHPNTLRERVRRFARA